jgi:hypothetical protein
VEREIHLERLLGKRVTDASGGTVGHIEEFRIERRGKDWVVVEYLVGVTGLLERLGVRNLARLLGVRLPERAAQRVPWDRLDLRDPEHPRVTR